MPAKHWINDDAGYEKWLSTHPGGFMANLSKRPHSNYFLIHRATHNLPDRSNQDTINPRTGNRYSKVTADTITELIAWARRRIPAIKKLGPRNFCVTCAPDQQLPLESVPTADGDEYIARANAIRACGAVKRPVGIAKPQLARGTANVFCRDPAVRAWVLQRAKGDCELCGHAAPFLTDDKEPFLESHHLVLLSEGGPDTPENTTAVCPNCHRNLHYGLNRADLRNQLTQMIAQKEAAAGAP